MEDNVYSAPKADLAEKEPNQGELASRWSRLGAAIVDTLIIMPISLSLLFFTGGFADYAEGNDPGVIYNLAVGLANFIFYVLINGHFLLTNGQTIGKKLLGIKIVTVDMQKAEISHLTKRYLFYFFVSLVPFVGPILSFVNIIFIFGKSKRCLHDLVAETCVIKV